ncbi:glycosyltransferase [Flavisericum labens]|uniref:glycosyltransferase n=1 Tax=Flavisericum labens TaxID=3377112 RepID=UPI00387B73A3
MKVIQLIDSLELGGTERVAVNYANALVNCTDGSFLCATRKEGLLKGNLLNGVGYLFLDKTSTLDLKAVFKLNSYIKKHRITLVHAHSTSYFLGTMMKLLNPKLILIWHDHYGNSDYLSKRPKWILKCSALFFNHVICVNTKLKHWAKEHLKVNTVSYLPNFAQLNEAKPVTKLQGEPGKRMVCLANLRPQKDHINLLNGFKLLVEKYDTWTLHLVGQDFEDAYSNAVKRFISENNLAHCVFLYGSCSDTLHVLKQSDIGVLASKSEGLPLALLEYGLAGLPVVVTNVGDCKKVISTADDGILIEPEREDLLAAALVRLIENKDLREFMGQNLKRKVTHDFSEASMIDKLMCIYKKYDS